MRGWEVFRQGGAKKSKCGICKHENCQEMFLTLPDIYSFIWHTNFRINSRKNVNPTNQPPLYATDQILIPDFGFEQVGMGMLPCFFCGIGRERAGQDPQVIFCSKKSF